MIYEIKKYFLEEKDEDLGDLASDMVLDFFIEKLAPEIYNQGIQDAYGFMKDRTEDVLELEKYQGSVPNDQRVFFMKAVLRLDKWNNLITFACKGLNLSFSVSPNISTIYSLDEVSDGYMVIQTNIGEEYIDLLGMLELDRYSESFMDKVKAIKDALKYFRVI